MHQLILRNDTSKILISTIDRAINRHSCFHDLVSVDTLQIYLRNFKYLKYYCFGTKHLKNLKYLKLNIRRHEKVNNFNSTYSKCFNVSFVAFNGSQF